MGLVGPAFQLRVELHCHKPRVVGQLHNLHQPPVRGQTGKSQPRRLQGLAVGIIELIAVAVTLVDPPAAISRLGPAPLRQHAGPAAQTHGAALFRHIHLILHQVNDRIGGPGIQLAGVGPGKARSMAGKLHHRHLHPQADAQEGHLLLPGIADGADLALHSPAAKAPGYQNTVAARQQLGCVLIGDCLAVHPPDGHLYAVFNAAVGQSLRHRQIGIVEGHILAHQGNGHRPLRGLGPVDHSGPFRQIRHMADEAQPPHHHIRQALPLQHQGHLIEDGSGQIGNGILRGNVAEKGDFVQHLPGHLPVAAAEDHIRLDAKAQKLLGRVLGGLAFQLPGAGDGDNEGHVDKHDIVSPPLRRHLPDSLQEGLGLNVAHGAADLHNGHIGLGDVQGVDPPLDLPGDMGDDLYRAAQKVSPPLPAEDLPVDLS